MNQPSSAYGVHSEVGSLRKVLVCEPGLAHERLTPSNCDDLLFDDVLWVQNAQRDHLDFQNKMTSRGVEVVELHDVLAQTMNNPTARGWLLDRKIIANEVGLGLVDETRAFLTELDSKSLSRYLIGGLSTRDLPADLAPGYRALVRESLGLHEYLMPPLPNTLYTRDTTCWVYGGLTPQPALLAGPARRNAAHEGNLRVPS
jgi:arginine deiminase